MTWLSSKTVILSVLTSLSFAIVTHSFSESTYISHFCAKVTTFAPESVYQANLKELLSKLLSEASRGELFYKKTTGYGVRKVYGSYLCRGDVSTAVCNDCVAFATEDALKKCPVEAEMVVWYDECMLRYSNRSYFETVSYKPSFAVKLNAQNESRRDEFQKKLKELMDESSGEVEGGAKRFLTKQLSFGIFGTIYSLMQCMPDLSGSDCLACLNQAIGIMPFSTAADSVLSKRVLFPSCNLRCEFYKFYNDDSNPSVILPPPLPPPISRPPGKTNGMLKSAIIGITIAVLLVCLAFGVCTYHFYPHKSRVKKYHSILHLQNDNGIESLKFNLETIQIATINFSLENKLGEGGFGEVYKGVLAEGQEIAVKRLSKSSGQGDKEFKNEVALVAKLQHRNLVRLLGFCLEGGETLLVYEFVPNKSLDYILFDVEKQRLLCWQTRCKIIIGIARGIMYLHEDSRLKVIHRDLKPSNVLLDADMQAKISDFGMAKMVNIDETQGNTKRIVGTYGYMAPEYAMEGLYSVKSDVFSFGVILLEILSGKKNSGFHLTKLAPSLLAYAWQLWNEGCCLDLMDPSLKDSFQPNEFIRHVHIGLLCVQEDVYNRPTMSCVVLMLTTETISLPVPKRPAFSVGKLRDNYHLEDFACVEVSDNGLTLSTLSPR